MQKFEKIFGIRRLIKLSVMTVEEADNYVTTQFYRESKDKQTQMFKELKKRIQKLERQKEVNEWILAIYKDDKLIGKMEVHSNDDVVASVKIEVPNKLRIQYGVEAIKQFRKICEEQKFFRRIELESNEITERFKKDYGITSDFIEVNVA